MGRQLAPVFGSAGDPFLYPLLAGYLPLGQTAAHCPPNRSRHAPCTPSLAAMGAPVAASLGLQTPPALPSRKVPVDRSRHAPCVGHPCPGRPHAAHCAVPDLSPGASCPLRGFVCRPSLAGRRQAAASRSLRTRPADPTPGRCSLATPFLPSFSASPFVPAAAPPRRADARYEAT